MLGETFDDNFTYPVNAEDATVQARYKLETPWLVDGAVGVHVWKKKVGVVVGVTRTSGSTPASIVAQIPHPFFDNQEREVSGEATFLERAETAAHVDLYYLATSGKLRLLVMGGPTWFRIEQQLATSVSVQETYPYDTATFRDVTTERVKASAPGANIAADVELDVLASRRCRRAGQVCERQRATQRRRRSRRLYRCRRPPDRCGAAGKVLSRVQVTCVVDREAHPARTAGDVWRCRGGRGERACVPGRR